MASIYTAEGLRAIAHLLDEQIEVDQRLSQNQLAAQAGVSANTIKAIRGNRSVTEAQIERSEHYEPGLLSLLAIAPHLIDPLTKKPFDTSGHPSRFEKIARGWEGLKPGGVKKPSRSELKAIPNSKAVAFILTAANRNPDLFRQNGLPVDGSDFKRLAAGGDPSMNDLGKLQTIFGFQGLNELAELYDLEPDQPIKPKDDRERNGVH